MSTPKLEPNIIDYFLVTSYFISAIKMSGLPNPPIWIGIDDKKREGDFRYYSDNSPIPIDAPIGRNQPNGNRAENCLTSFVEEVQRKRVSKRSSIHPKWWDRPCSDRNMVIVHSFVQM